MFGFKRDIIISQQQGTNSGSNSLLSQNPKIYLGGNSTLINTKAGRFLNCPTYIALKRYESERLCTLQTQESP